MHSGHTHFQNAVPGSAESDLAEKKRYGRNDIMAKTISHLWAVMFVTEAEQRRTPSAHAADIVRVEMSLAELSVGYKKQKDRNYRHKREMLYVSLLCFHRMVQPSS
jgi:hypothetical protein